MDSSNGPTVTAMLDDGPLKGRRVEVQVVQGRPPSTIEADGKDGRTSRYCLAELPQAGGSATYTFLYEV